MSSPHQPGSISSHCLMRPQLRGRAKSLVNNNTRSDNRLAEPCGYWPFQGSSSLEEQAATKKGESAIEWGSRSKRSTQRAPKPQKKTSKNGLRNYQLFYQFWVYFGVYFGAIICSKRGPKMGPLLEPLGPASQGSGSCDFTNQTRMVKLLATGIILKDREGYIYIYIYMHTQYVSIYTYGYIYVYIYTM